VLIPRPPAFGTSCRSSLTQTRCSDTSAWYYQRYFSRFFSIFISISLPFLPDLPSSPPTRPPSYASFVRITHYSTAHNAPNDDSTLLNTRYHEHVQTWTYACTLMHMHTGSCSTRRDDLPGQAQAAAQAASARLPPDPRTGQHAWKHSINALMLLAETPHTHTHTHTYTHTHTNTHTRYVGQELQGRQRQPVARHSHLLHGGVAALVSYG
jgi:hypothetical protein